jgi:cobyrinic acid a,c-diamide synthase
VASADKRRMNYRQMRVMDDCLIAGRGATLRGHEYEWSRIEYSNGAVHPAYELSDPAGYKVGHEGYARPGLLASNIHLHFGQEPNLALNLLRACARRRASTEALV